LADDVGSCVDILYDDQRWRDLDFSMELLMQKIVDELLKQDQLDVIRNSIAYSVKISVLLSNDCCLQLLNHRYRERNKVANVLSFPNITDFSDVQSFVHTPAKPAKQQSVGDGVSFGNGCDKSYATTASVDCDMKEAEKDDLHIGDIALGYEEILRESIEYGVRFEVRVAHLFLHGLLHLFGFVHDNDTDREVMEGIEISLLRKLRYAHPYILVKRDILDKIE